jgi:hypothetical protein
VAKLIRLTHKIAIKLTYWQTAVPFAALALGGQCGNFWIHRLMFTTHFCWIYFVIIPSYVKVKVKLSLCLTKHHAMKAYWGELPNKIMYSFLA